MASFNTPNNIHKMVALYVLCWFVFNEDIQKGVGGIPKFDISFRRLETYFKRLRYGCFLTRSLERSAVFM